MHAYQCDCNAYAFAFLCIKEINDFRDHHKRICMYVITGKLGLQRKVDGKRY